MVLWLLGLVALIYGVMVAILPPAFYMMMLSPLALMFVLVVWILPETDNPPDRFMGRMFFLYFISAILWPYYLAIQIPGFPLIEIRRAFSGLATLALLVSLSVSPRFRAQLSEIFWVKPVFAKMFLAFLLVQILSLGFPKSYSSATSAFVKEQIAWTAVFFMSLYVFSKKGNVIKWVKTLCILGIIISIIGFLEYRNQGILWANHIPSFLKVSDPAMENLLTPVFRSGEYRITTTFSVSLVLAEFLSLTMPFFLHYVGFGKNIWLRILCAVADLMVFAAIVLTQARLGLVGAMTAHLVFALIWAFKSRQRDRQGLLSAAIVFGSPAIVFVVGLAVMFVPALHVRLLGGGTHVASTQGRFDQFQAGMPLLAKRPLFGYGPMQGGAVLNYTNAAGEVSIDSGVLAVLLNYGLVGFFLYFGMIIFLIVHGMRTGFAAKDWESSFAMPAASCLIVWLATRLVLAQEDNYSLIFMVMALLLTLIYRASLSAGKEGAGAPGR
ncbi:MAG: O-antigen ligase domain-containing protein [Sphingomonadales bacterium]|nr:MAG: O-antigen ligase domain-containing protein [Sphingomonadales bacterium]TNF05291.1 MAG: O-antigen ligase domain-containing protein [Sphingomonadales bacterium]